ncbi:substrate-binding domain-containing protein [Gramella sp. GC03-9]|uniref:Substrate-binding domain-containing protein n=1 Tax=Christiangramia oceanisediminis TaxID=2920386 RepID=A0A9X2KY53_9FLAO|nr:substrate-binding domain-containing protein [Gramella oceanisediminis]MCP9200430.1 substrate-binding domain-containing protein [Gramella oceanisediminis]
MKTIKIGGVPEHFNLPWHLCMEQGKFEDEDVHLIWKDFPEGTGAMCKALRSGELDAAIILTEGIVKDITQGNDAKIIQTYIGSPLIWGIHVDAGSPYKNLQELKGTRAAISRKGSGSHLMAYVNASNRGWDLDKLDFEIVDNLDGAIKALKEDRAQYFMWEHFTTKPLVDNKTFRLIADCPTPWPCFVIAARTESIRMNPQRLKKMLNVINAETTNFKMKKEIDQELAKRYDQKLEDIRKWLDLTRWSQEQISEEDLDNVQNTLLKLNLIGHKRKFSDLVHSF